VEPKVLLYYQFVPLDDPEAIRLWQHTLCESLGLGGRILISRHGINGTVGGELRNIKRYIKATRSYPKFKGIDFKWSEGSGADFPRLRVRVRDEIVTFGAPDEIKVDENGVIGGGTHLSPAALHDLVAERGDEVVFFDGRNAFEAKIGKFRGAVVPNTTVTKDFVTELDSGTYDHLKNRPVVTYCTGGVRCEVLSVLMKNRGFTDVYQLDGGVVRYGEKYGNRGLWEGSLYLFDARMNHEFGPDTTVLGRCEHCGTATSRFVNCANLDCRRLMVWCEECDRYNVVGACGPEHAGRR
jgi:UPF0176 protein